MTLLKQTHAELKALLLDTFGPWLVVPGPTGWRTTLADIWGNQGPQDQGRIIIVYHDDTHTDPEHFYPTFIGR